MPESDAPNKTAGETVLLITSLRGLPFLVPRDTDWEALLELAGEHGVLPILHPSLLEKGVEIPDSFTAAVRERREAAETLARELENLLKQFAERGIGVLPLKGPALAAALYGDVAMRSFYDLDLLVRRDDFERAELLLFDLGFAARGPVDDYHRGFRRGEVLLELHFGVASDLVFPLDSFPFDVDGVWSRALPGSFRGQPMHIMSDDDLVLYLCLHGLKHGFAKLIWVVDIGRALAHMRQSTPAQLAINARRRGLELPLLIGCEMVREILPQQSPQEVDAVIAESPEVAARARRVVARLFVEGPGVSNDAEIRSLYLQTEPSARQRWRRRLSFFAPTLEDYAWVERHRIYDGLAPVLRPFRLLQKYGPSRVWRILFPPPM
jgi:hypothetical protein